MVVPLPFVGLGPLDSGTVCAGTGAAFDLRSSAQDFGAAFGGEDLGVSSALPLSSGAAGVTVPAFLDSSSATFVLADFCVVDATLGGFADFMGINGTAGLVAVRVCTV